MKPDRDGFEVFLRTNRPRPPGRAAEGLRERVWRALELESGIPWWLKAAVPVGVAGLALAVQLWMGASTSDPSDLRLAADVQWAFTPVDSEDGDVVDPAGDFLEIAGGI